MSSTAGREAALEVRRQAHLRLTGVMHVLHDEIRRRSWTPERTCCCDESMTIAFVPGVPVTSAVWTPLIKQLPLSKRQDVVTLSPPGFGAAVPVAFGATFVEYRDWLI